MALAECCFELFMAIEAPAVDTVAQDEIEMRRRKMTVEVLERGDHVLFRSKAGRARIGLDGPEVLGGEEELLIVGRVTAAPYEQHAFDGRIACVFREDVAFHDDAIGGVEWRWQPEALSQNARGKAVFREKGQK